MFKTNEITESDIGTFLCQHGIFEVVATFLSILPQELTAFKYKQADSLFKVANSFRFSSITRPTLPAAEHQVRVLLHFIAN